MQQAMELASVFGDQMSGIEHASTQNQVIDAVIVFIIAGGVNIAADRTNLPALKWLTWGFSGLGLYVLYLAFFA
jgi:hypothetical protein